jgi:TP901 family phage tail tape measure protein
MAVNLGSMNITLGLDLSKFEKSMKGVRRRFGRLSGQLKMAGRDLTAAISAPLAGVGLLATKTAIDWETSFAKVQKTVKGTDAELGELAKGLRDMSLRLPVTAGGLASIAEEAGRLGIKRGDIEKFTETIVNLAETSTMAAEEAATALARFNAITKNADTRALATSLTILGSEFATTESEIMEMGLRIAATGKLIGMSEADILGLSAAMTSVGIAAEMGGTAMSKVLIGIAEAAGEGGDKLNTMASIAGMSADKFRQKFEKDAAGAVNALIKGLNKLEKEEAFKAVDMLGFSADRTRRMLLTLAGAEDQLTKTLSRSSDAWDDEHALQKLAEKRYKTTGAQLTVLKNRFMEMTRVLGEALIPAVISLLEVIRDRFLPIIQGWIDAFAATTPAMKATIITVSALAAAIGPLLIVVGALAGSVAGLASVLTLVAAHPVVALIAGIAALAMAVVGYNYVADKMKSITSGVGVEMDDTSKRIKAYEDNIKRLTRMEEIRAELTKKEIEQQKELDAHQKTKGIIRVHVESTDFTRRKEAIKRLSEEYRNLEQTTKGLSAAELKQAVTVEKVIQAVQKSMDAQDRLEKAKSGASRKAELYNALLAEESQLQLKLATMSGPAVAQALEDSEVRYNKLQILLKAVTGEGGNFAEMLAEIKAKADAANETAKESISSWEAWKQGMDDIIAGTSQIFDDFKTNVLTSFTDGIGDAFADVLVSGASFGDTLKSLWKSLAKMVISRLVAIGAQLLIFGAIQRAVNKDGAKATISAKAGETFAATFASVMSAVPFPLNIALAPAMAAGQAAIMTASALGLAEFAEGGIISQPQLVLAGEAGPEAIVPLDRMGEFGGGGQTINLHVDGELIAQEAVKGMPAFIDARLGGI